MSKIQQTSSTTVFVPLGTSNKAIWRYKIDMFKIIKDIKERIWEKGQYIMQLE